MGGYRYLANKYGISSKSQVSNWVNVYREYGEEGLLRKHQNQKYSVQFKLNALELYQTSEMSYREVASTLEMNNPALIANWMRNFREAGIEGLSKEKGRPLTLTRKKENKKENTTTEERDRIKALEKQVRSLQIENAFLKELRKLRKQEAQQRR
ncbi:helix-turn-helix domain-containing protein, partial [Enterococcus gallinarum]|uniref:helix-turn-helix domain-containing protein n=2 Tax=Enterococcus gallinarum TaxID=1353 RepID=UPI00288EA4D3